MINRKSNHVRLGVMLYSLAALAPFIAYADATSSRAATLSVYECVINGRRTVSDQPCGPNAQPREIADSNRMAAQDTSILSRHETGTKARQTADDTDNKKAACNKLREQQKQVESQQRIGYTAKQGESLRARRDKLIERYASLKCERYR